MIKTEFLNDNTLVRHYSDAGMLILQNETGTKYYEAIDTVPCQYTYTETSSNTFEVSRATSEPDSSFVSYDPEKEDMSI